MRPRLDAARERLIPALGRLGPSKGTDLARALDVSQASVLRFLQEACTEVVQSGQAPQAALRGAEGLAWQSEPDAGLRRCRRWPSQLGQAGELALVQPQGSWLTLAGSGWPVPPEGAVGW